MEIQAVMISIPNTACEWWKSTNVLSKINVALMLHSSEKLNSLTNLVLVQSWSHKGRNLLNAKIKVKLVLEWKAWENPMDNGVSNILYTLLLKGTTYTHYINLCKGKRQFKGNGKFTWHLADIGFHWRLLVHI